jgi:hypothetical protein
MSGAADKKEDFQGHALGVKTRVPAGKDTEVISTLGYGVKATVNENDSAAIGYKTDTSIDGLGYGIACGIRSSVASPDHPRGALHGATGGKTRLPLVERQSPSFPNPSPACPRLLTDWSAKRRGFVLTKRFGSHTYF